MAHTWSYLGDIVSDATHHMYYRGQRIKEAYYRGEKVWEDNSERQKVGSVCFWDWNGDLLAEYSANEFLSLQEMPHLHKVWTANMLPFSSRSSSFYDSVSLTNIDAPIENGDIPILNSDGYNWELDEAKAFVSKVGFCDIGAIYKSDYTYLWITVPNGENLTTSLFFTALDSNPISVDFGDGIIETYNVVVSNSDITGDDSPIRVVHHAYPSVGHYLIKIRGKISLGGYIYKANIAREVFCNPTCIVASHATSNYYNYYPESVKLVRQKNLKRRCDKEYRDFRKSPNG